MAHQPSNSIDWTSDLTFYRQQRVDGGIRTGIMLGMETVFEKFEGYVDRSEDEYDPSLAWSVDLRCRGEDLPVDPEGAKDWLLAHEVEIVEGFRLYADHLGAGSDPTGLYPLRWAGFPNPPKGVTMTIVCGALRRIDALYLASRLIEVGENWATLVGELEPTFHQAS